MDRAEQSSRGHKRLLDSKYAFEITKKPRLGSDAAHNGVVSNKTTFDSQRDSISSRSRSKIHGIRASVQRKRSRRKPDVDSKPELLDNVDEEKGKLDGGTITTRAD